jgi:hypothetical protein
MCRVISGGGSERMADDATRRYSADEIEAMIAAGDYVPAAPDAPEIELDEDFWRNARIVMPKPAPKPVEEATSLRAEDT